MKRTGKTPHAPLCTPAQWLADSAAAGPRLVFTVWSDNAGALRSFEDGFNSVRTPYLIPLAADDELMPGFIPRALAIPEQAASPGAVIGPSIEVGHGSDLYRFPTRSTWGRLSAATHLCEF
jgi:hypothetical protein